MIIFPLSHIFSDATMKFRLHQYQLQRKKKNNKTLKEENNQSTKEIKVIKVNVRLCMTWHRFNDKIM